jgi:hypothetical protein
MERFTERDEFGGVYPKTCILYGRCDCFLKTRNEKVCARCSNLCQRLADYEDTGLSPEDVRETQEAVNPIPMNRFHEIMTAERDGQCIVLPIKPGTTVWTLTIEEDSPQKPAFIREGRVDRYGLGVDGIDIMILRYFGEPFSPTLDVYCDPDDIGETIFLTKQDAERKLQELNNEQE